jgi:hypothetical protein
MVRAARKSRPGLSRAHTRNLHGYLNAFAPTGGAVVMDNAATASQTSHQAISQPLNAVDSNGVLPFTILLTGNSSVPVVTWTEGGIQIPLIIDDSHINLSIPGMSPSNSANATKADPIQDPVAMTQTDMWRLVSAALKVTLLNNDQENDGWFEAVRLRAPTSSGWFTITERSGGPTDRADLIPNSKFLNFIRGVSFADEESYHAGSLKDINKIQFDLHHLTSDHPFTKVPQSVDIGYYSTAQPPAGNFPNRLFPLDPGELGGLKLMEKMVDQNTDMIAIRIFPRAGATGSKLLLEVAQNTEVVYPSGSTLARFHQPAVYSAQAKAAQSRATDYKKSKNLAGQKRPNTGLSGANMIE